MSETTCDLFFYGLFMDAAVLREKGVKPLRPRKALVPGFRLRIGSRALLVPQFGAQAYGMVFALAEREIAALYAEPDLTLYRRASVVACFEDGMCGAVTTFNLGASHASSVVNREYATRLQVLFEQLSFPTDVVQLTN